MRPLTSALQTAPARIQAGALRPRRLPRTASPAGRRRSPPRRSRCRAAPASARRTSGDPGVPVPRGTAATGTCWPAWAGWAMGDPDAARRTVAELRGCQARPGVLAAIRICPLPAAKKTPWPSQSVTGFASRRTATLSLPGRCGSAVSQSASTGRADCPPLCAEPACRRSRSSWDIREHDGRNLVKGFTGRTKGDRTDDVVAIEALQSWPCCSDLLDLHPVCGHHTRGVTLSADVALASCLFSVEPPGIEPRGPKLANAAKQRDLEPPFDDDVRAERPR